MRLFLAWVIVLAATGFVALWQPFALVVAGVCLMCVWALVTIFGR